MNHHDFYLRVADALAGCQLVEQELKLYIATAYNAIQRHLQGRVPFKFSADDCQNYALGRLIDTFKNLNNDDELIKNLKEFKSERNFLSHRAITFCLDHDMNLSVPVDLEERLSNIKNNAGRLHKHIRNSGIALEFDDVSGAN